MINTAKQLHSDRFIPFRSLSEPKNKLANNLTTDKAELKETNSTSTHTKKHQFTFNKSLSTHPSTVLNLISSLPKTCKTIKKQAPLVINCSSIIQAPGVINDFYYNTIDMSNKDFLGLGLGRELHMFRLSDQQQIKFINRREFSLITCVKFSVQDQLLMSSDQDGLIEIHDIEKIKTLRVIKNHTCRVGRLQTDVMNPSIFYSGSKDYKININDLREKSALVSSLISHKSQVCGLSFKGKYLASGSNDGVVKIWDIRSQQLLQNLTYHKSNNAAVKALSWCPWKSNTLVSGSGKKDHKIVIYDFDGKKVQNTINVTRQVSDICWRESTQEMIYSYCNRDYSKGLIKVHNYFNPSCRMKKMSNHQGRILGLKMSKKDDSMLYSLSADESLMCWNLDQTPIKVNGPQVLNNNFEFQ